jgi:hypothetical protein
MERRDATVTKFAGLRRQWAGDISKVLILGLTLGFAQVAAARFMPGASSSTNDFIYVQAPSLNSVQPYLYQPVIHPREVVGTELDQAGHLWPRLISYSMETDALEAFVQPNLKVGMQYNYSFQFELSARNGEGRAMAIPDGWYQLQIAVIRKAGGSRDSVNPYARYVTSNSMFLKVSGGSFGRRISLRFPDITMTSLKHHLFVELIPLKEECEDNGRKIRCINLNSRGEPDANNSVLEPRPGYKTYLVEMPFIPFQPSGGKVRDAEDLSEKDQAFLGGSLAKYIARAQLYKNKRDLQMRADNSPADHAKKNHLDLMSVNDPALAEVSGELSRLLNTRALGVLKVGDDQKALFTALCAQLVAHQSEFQERHNSMPFKRQREIVVQNNIRWCAASPEKYMRLSRVLHVGRPVAGKIERIAQKNLTYTIMANYMSSRSQSRDSVSTVSVKPPGILVKFTEQIGLGFGHSVNFVNGRSQVDTGIASMSTSLDFNYVIFNVPTAGSQQCLEVRALPDTYAYFYNRRPGANTGIYICGPKNESVVETPEVYAHAFERCRDTTMMECDTLTQSVNVSLRGERELSAFFYAIRGGITPDHNNRVMPFGDAEGAERYFANVPLMDDMEIVTPVEYAREKVPSFLQLISGFHREF